MKKSFVLILVAIAVEISIAGPAALLPPPGEDSVEVGADGEPARGLKGSNPLASLQKTQSKCSVEGSYGIKNECSKYIDCGKVGVVSQSKFCPGGKFFDHKKRTCVKSSEAQCKNVCPTDGTTMPDPNDAEGHLKCTKGVPMPFKGPASR